MSEKRVPLYERLPEIYRIRDQEQIPPGQLQSYLSLVEEVYGAIHKNIESLYHDLFIETCDDWVIPYIGDLLGTSYLSGDPWTLRADVADTIALRRRKGTLGAIELLTHNLTKWGVHCAELRENLVWSQHLNHQRPDAGGKPPYADLNNTELQKAPMIRHGVVRGGTVTMRDPAMLSLLNTPFDPFSHLPDFKPPSLGNIRYNLPNLAIFLWRLAAYRVSVSKPGIVAVHPRDASIDLTKYPDAAGFIVRVVVHPLAQSIRLFNTYNYDPDRQPPVVTQVDETPGPIPTARLTTDSPAGNPGSYVAVETYNQTDPSFSSLDTSDVGLQLHVPESKFNGDDWTFRGANLCAWESGLQLPLRDREIAIDPVIGRVSIGVNTEEKGNALMDHLLLTYTYGAVGAVGAHPISRLSSPTEFNRETVDLRIVNYHKDNEGLRKALDNIQNSTNPIVIEIHDSMTHELDLNAVAGTVVEDGGPNLRLNRSLIIRAAKEHRPVIKLVQQLRFRPTNVKGVDEEEQNQFDAVMSRLTVRLEGLYLTRESDSEPLIARAALHSLEVLDCTLSPGGYRKLDETRAPIVTSMELHEPYGFSNPSEEKSFNQKPEIILQRTTSGPLFIDTSYKLYLTDCILDAGSGVNEESSTAAYALSGSGADPSTVWGPPTQVSGITVFGRMRVESINGRGGIWVHTLEVLNNQTGCIKFSYFAPVMNRLPQNHGCVSGEDTKVIFISEEFENQAYAQLALTSHVNILEQGPKRSTSESPLVDYSASEDPNYIVSIIDGKTYKLGDQMGAFGFLMEAHKWRNIQIRYREFMPVGVRPLLIPVT